MKVALSNGNTGFEICPHCDSAEIDCTRAVTRDGRDLLDVWNKKPYFYSWCFECGAKWSTSVNGLIFGFTAPKPEIKYDPEAKYNDEDFE